MSIKGRGADRNPHNRFEELKIVLNEGEALENKTTFIKDSSKTILSENNSPDIPFRYSINPFRGCEHGCAYCYARPSHEYLGFSAGLDFETKIVVKENAPELLRKKLESKSWEGDLIVLSGNTDCYQPCERHFQITRKVLSVLSEFQNPVGIITKNALVTRDLDLLKTFLEFDGVSVTLSITTLSNDLAGKLEPRTSRPQARLDAVRTLAVANIPVHVNIAPVIPGLNDMEIPQILKSAKDAGAQSASFTPLRLPLAVGPLFTEWLETHVPLKKEKILNHIRDIRGGELNNSEFGQRMKGQGPIYQQIEQMFKLFAKKYDLLGKPTLKGRASRFTRQQSFDLSTGD